MLEDTPEDVEMADVQPFEDEMEDVDMEWGKRFSGVEERPRSDPNRVYFLMGHGCEFDQLVVPATVRVIMHDQSTTLYTCTSNIDSLYSDGHLWSTYQDLVEALSQPQYQDYRQFRIYSAGSLIPNLAVESYKNSPSGFYQLPISERPPSLRRVPNPRLFLRDLLPIMVANGGGVLFIITCREPCFPERPLIKYSLGTPLKDVLGPISLPEPRGILGKIDYYLVEKYYHHLFFINLFTGGIDRRVALRTKRLVYCGRSYDQGIFADRDRVYATTNLAPVPGAYPEQYIWGNLTIFGPPGQVQVYEDGRRREPLPELYEYTPLTPSLGLTWTPDQVIFLIPADPASIIARSPTLFRFELDTLAKLRRTWKL